MKAKIMKDHPGEGLFPTFETGTKVILAKEGTHFPHWYACDIAGHQTYVPDIFPQRRGSLGGPCEVGE